METVAIGGVQVSRFILGGNPFSGFSHQSPARDREMVRHYTTARIKEVFRQAEALGVTTHIGRADHHLVRVLAEYWDEGGGIRWLAQTCPEVGAPEQAIRNAVQGGAAGVHIHGGVMDKLLAEDRLAEVPPLVARIREAGCVAGIAGHNPAVFERAVAAGLEVDYFMCSYYNPSDRSRAAAHDPVAGETFDPAHRERMVAVIADLPRPVIHYKVLAAGRTPPAEAFAYVARHLRPQDAVCVGIHTGDDPAMLATDVRLLETALCKEPA